MDTFRRLVARLGPWRYLFGASLAAATVASLFDGFTFALLIPFLRLLFGEGTAIAEVPTVLERALGWIAGPLFAGSAAETLVAVVGLILLAMVVKNVAHYTATVLGATVQEHVVRDLRLEAYAAMQRQGLDYFQRTRGGDLLARLIADTEQVRTAVSLGLAAAVRSGVLAGVYLAILVALDWKLATVTLALVPAIALGMRPLFRRVTHRAEAAVAARGDLTAIAAEAVAGVRLIKTHTAEREEAARFGRAASHAAETHVTLQRWAFLASPLGEVLGTAVIVVLLVLGLQWAGPGGTLRPELFLTFLAVTMRLLPPVKQLAQFPAHVADALAAARRVFALIDREPVEVDPPGAPAFPGLTDTITFEDVHLRYPDGTGALRGVRLSVRRGEVVAIVGPSGAGKSTLVDLLPRLLEPTAGRVLIDGQSLTVWSRGSLRRAIGYVGQETVVVHDTVRANIGLGVPEATDEAIERVARAAHAHEFISALPAQYDTVLGERGQRLSGGERQRIALARVLLRDPEILILDEATSALDAESERLVQDTLEHMFRDRTVLVVAHRESTVRRADRVVTLDGGVVTGDAVTPRAWSGAP